MCNDAVNVGKDILKAGAKFIDDNLDTIGKVAIAIGGVAVAVGSAGLAIGGMPVLIPVGAGTIITGTMIAKGAIVVLGVSALVAATAGGTQTITGLLKKDLVGNKISVEESNNRISNGVTNFIGAIMLAGSTYMLNSVYNSSFENTISKSELLKYKVVENKLKELKDPNGNYENIILKKGYTIYNPDEWRKGIISFYSDEGVRFEYHFVKNINDGTIISEKIFKVLDGNRVYFNIKP